MLPVHHSPSTCYSISHLWEAHSLSLAFADNVCLAKPSEAVLTVVLYLGQHWHGGNLSSPCTAFSALSEMKTFSALSLQPQQVHMHLSLSSHAYTLTQQPDQLDAQVLFQSWWVTLLLWTYSLH